MLPFYLFFFTIFNSEDEKRDWANQVELSIYGYNRSAVCMYICTVHVQYIQRQPKILNFPMRRYSLFFLSYRVHMYVYSYIQVCTITIITICIYVHYYRWENTDAHNSTVQYVSNHIIIHSVSVTSFESEQQINILFSRKPNIESITLLRLIWVRGFETIDRGSCLIVFSIALPLINYIYTYIRTDIHTYIHTWLLLFWLERYHSFPNVSDEEGTYPDCRTGITWWTCVHVGGHLRGHFDLPPFPPPSAEFADPPWLE